tara:strand:- start:7326 stop:8105 length:780 start_codon:yes stop_codon:yes gene_type:complete
MLKQIGKRLILTTLGVVAVALAIWGAYNSALKGLRFPSIDEINDARNIGVKLSASETTAVLRSRQSAVQVYSFDVRDGGISAMTGTYLIYKNKYFVLTAAHGIYSPCAFTNIIVDEELYPCKQYVLADTQWDYVVIQVDPIADRVPVKVPDHIPHRQEWIHELATQNTIFYTGYPNDGGPYTFDGRVVGYNENMAMFVDSYGWSGSSGAGVFSQSGNLIGWVMALEVGQTEFGPQVLENFIWVIPLFKIDWPAVQGFAE